jgi:NADH:ubiquinone oxidoreductase subunit E
MEAKAANNAKARAPEIPAKDIAALLDEIGVSRESNLIAVLQRVQGRFGYLPAAALREITRRTRIPLSRIYGVLSFYAQFYTEPRGRHTVRCCRGTACHVRGSKQVIHTASRRLGLEDGQTSDDMQFSLETVACLGACALSPVVVIDGKYYGKMTPRRLEQVLNRLLAEEAPAGEKA